MTRSRTGSQAQGLRIFLASFLVLFLEIALIRWLPAYIRLLAYFSNFILLASFLGIGVGCLVASRRTRLFAWFPLVLAGVVGAAYVFRLEVGVSSSSSIYFSSGTDRPVVLVESTLLLPVIFVSVALLFATLAQRMAREMATLPPLRAYTLNLAGSVAGVAAFGVASWLESPPAAWFAAAFAAALPLLLTPDPGDGRGRPPSRAAAAAGIALLAGTLALVHVMARGAIWSPYYKIGVFQQGPDTVVEVNNIFHQSMAPLATKEYFYEWPYAVFGDTFEDVLILGAGSGTDVAAALKHGARRVDAVEIDPAIIRIGRERNPDRPYSDPRVHVVNDDARHFLRTTDRQYDLVVFALIDSLTLQSSFSGVRLESYMFTEESFRAVRDRLKPDGLLVVYNYFREPWLVDRLANIAAAAFDEEPRVHVHEARAYLGVMLAGPRASALKADPPVPARVTAFGQPHAPSPARRHERDRSVEASTDDWPFLYLEDRHLPRHYAIALVMILAVSSAAVFAAARGVDGARGLVADRARAAQFFFLGAGFMLLETKSIIQFALLWGSTWVVASLVIVAVLVMAMAANLVVSKVEVTRPWLAGALLLALLGLNFLLPVGRIGFASRALESAFYAALVFSPIFCAGLLFGSAIAHSTAIARDYGVNLLGAMAGGVAEYLSLVTGFRVLLLVIAACYVGALLARQADARAAVAPAGRAV
jgi:SAM-dependent methyltransferase